MPGEKKVEKRETHWKKDFRNGTGPEGKGKWRVGWCPYRSIPQQTQKRFRKKGEVREKSFHGRGKPEYSVRPFVLDEEKDGKIVQKKVIGEGEKHPGLESRRTCRGGPTQS